MAQWRSIDFSFFYAGEDSLAGEVYSPSFSTPLSFLYVFFRLLFFFVCSRTPLSRYTNALSSLFAARFCHDSSDATSAPPVAIPAGARRARREPGPTIDRWLWIGAWLWLVLSFFLLDEAGRRFCYLWTRLGVSRHREAVLRGTVV